jgi:hypothetical protein
MRLLLVFALSAGVVYAGQEPAASPDATAVKPAVQEPPVVAPAPPQKQTIVVPARTIIPVKLTDSLWSKTARPGDGVHAMTILPVTVGNTVAIPTGTFVEGVVDKVWRRASSSHPAIQMHFTELRFTNGYSVPLETTTTEVQERKPGAAPGSVGAGNEYDAYAFPPPILGASANSSPAQFPFPTQPTPPPLQPLPQPSHPNMGVIIGASLGATAALLITTIYLNGRTTRTGYTMLDAGSQIDLTLQSPLELDAREVAAAAGSSSAQ